MRGSIVKLKDIMGRDVSADEAGSVAEHLLACVTHVTNARPLFGVLNTKTTALEWTAGGADFHDALKSFANTGSGSLADTMTFLQMFKCFGISSHDITDALKQMMALEVDASMTMIQPMLGADDRYYRMVLRRRREPNEALVQFTLFDITAFQKSAKRTQDMAQSLVAELNVPMGADLGADLGTDLSAGASTRLLGVLDGLDDLLELRSDDAVHALAHRLSEQVTLVSERMVELLRGYETRFETSYWQPEDLDSGLRPFIPTHSTPVSDWRELHQEFMVDVEGEPALRGLDLHSVANAYTFVSHAASVMAISPVEGSIFILNGQAAGQEFSTVEDFVRALDVEENSIRTAVDYFESLHEKSGLGLFAMEGHNIEAWGRPGQYGGWQVMMSPAQGQGVDVRGLFHGLKNLLLHLQVLYVVKGIADVDQVRAGLTDTAVKIRRRLIELDNVARIGRRGQSRVLETVGQWLEAAAVLGREGVGKVIITADGVEDTAFSAIPGEMEDTLEELARNAFLYDATTVHVSAMKHSGHLCLSVSDDGRGMSDDKLEQLRRVLETRHYDATLSTRDDGTGNGLLSAANAVGRFIDGRFSVEHGPQGRGVEFSISMKLPG